MERSIDIQYFSSPDVSSAAAKPPSLGKASFGKRIRYLRGKFGVTAAELAEKAGISLNSLLRLEREETKGNEWIIAKILRCFGERAKEGFPGVEDVFNLLVPIKDFGSWLKNLRLRQGLHQADLAKILGVSEASVTLYQHNIMRPGKAVLERLRAAFKLNDEIERYLPK